MMHETKCCEKHILCLFCLDSHYPFMSPSMNAFPLWRYCWQELGKLFETSECSIWIVVALGIWVRWEDRMCEKTRKHSLRSGSLQTVLREESIL